MELTFNPTTETLHRKPATENCNLDDAKSERAITPDELSELDQYSLCAYCFRAGESPFDAA
jgi:hypothetical protein